jgi:cytochrome c peroxidase
MLRHSFFTIIVVIIVPAFFFTAASAQQSAQQEGLPAWMPGALAHEAKFPAHEPATAQAATSKNKRNKIESAQSAPAVIPQLAITPDTTGKLATLQPSGVTRTANNSFFQALGTNGRSCFSCHQMKDGWSINPADVQARYEASNGTDPIFRLIDGATCPDDDVSTPEAMKKAFSLVLNKGLIRVFLPMPANTQFEIVSVDDPYNCNTKPATGLTSPTTGIVSVYRRPLPSTGLRFNSSVLDDGREPSLLSQARDAVMIHEQRPTLPDSDTMNQAVSFETNIYTAQVWDQNAGYLNQNGAQGGPAALAAAQFYLGMNDPFGNDPTGAPFNPLAFTMYEGWQQLKQQCKLAEYRESVARGEKIFNSRTFDITGVAGLNDLVNNAAIAGTCTTCHDTPAMAIHSVSLFMDTGVTDGPIFPRPADLPLFTLKCIAGPLAGQTFQTTDPGRALVTGKCADIAKIKVPSLRGLAARPPYFQAGEAPTLNDVVDYYDQRFDMGLSSQDKQDLVNFLQTL